MHTDFVSSKQACQMLDLYSSTLRRWAIEGRIPCEIVGNRRLFMRSDVQRLAAERAAKGENK